MTRNTHPPRRPLTAAFFVALLYSECCAGELNESELRRVTELIELLGNDSYSRREAASRELGRIGERALPALRNANRYTDIEIRLRVREVARSIMLASRKSPSIGLEMVLIEPEEFLMGSPTNESGRRTDETRHRVRLTRPMLLGAYEVTQDEFERVMDFNPSWFARSGAGRDKIGELDTRRFPVESVSWFDAIEFCNRLSRRDGRPPYYALTDVKHAGDSIQQATVQRLGGSGYRLPTEAEWEFACRARTDSAFHYGPGNTGREANLLPIPNTGYGAGPSWDAVKRTTRVGSYAPNPWGLFDLHGNVGEWCWDWYDKDYYTVSPADDPPGPSTGLQRVLRGGSWLVNWTSCRSASRFWHTPDERKEYGGFRVARTP